MGTIYSVDDANDMYEIIAIDAFNEHIAQSGKDGQPKSGISITQRGK